MSFKPLNFLLAEQKKDHFDLMQVILVTADRNRQTGQPSQSPQPHTPVPYSEGVFANQKIRELLCPEKDGLIDEIVLILKKHSIPQIAEQKIMTWISKYNVYISLISVNLEKALRGEQVKDFRLSEVMFREGVGLAYLETVDELLKTKNIDGLIQFESILDGLSTLLKLSVKRLLSNKEENAGTIAFESAIIAIADRLHQKLRINLRFQQMKQEKIKSAGQKYFGAN